LRLCGAVHRLTYYHCRNRVETDLLEATVPMSVERRVQQRLLALSLRQRLVSRVPSLVAVALCSLALHAALRTSGAAWSCLHSSSLVGNTAPFGQRETRLVAGNRAQTHSRLRGAAGVPVAASERQAPDVADIADGRTFVSIAAYFDPELPNTIRSMLQAADHPERIAVGVVWQGMEEEDDIGLTAEALADLAALWGLDSVDEPQLLPKFDMPNGASFQPMHLLGGRLRVIRMPASDARGPCWARYLAQLLWVDEDLYLQLDSHMRFAPSWDSKAKEQLTACARQSDRPVLCSYCAGYELGLDWKDTPDEYQLSCLNCASSFDSDGILLIEARELKQHWPEPTPSLFWSGQFHFSSAQVLKEVPYDPQLQMMFFGEEILTSVRLFTHGWDMYSPSAHIFFHLWDRGYRRVYFKDNQARIEEFLGGSQRRLHALLGSGSGRYLSSDLKKELSKDIDPWPLPGGGLAEKSNDAFGMGSVRALAEYEAISGITFRDHRLTPTALRGGAFTEDTFQKKADDLGITPVPIRLKGMPVHLTALGKVPFLPNAAVNGRPSYSADVEDGIDGMTPIAPGKYVLWYSATNSTWVMNRGGVAHGMGMPVEMLLLGPGADAITPPTVSSWYAYCDYTQRWTASKKLKCVEKGDEEGDTESADEWSLESVLPEFNFR